VTVLHDRAIRGTRANIDHIAIAPSGVWVIDTKRFHGKIRVQQPLFGQDKLLVAARDRTKLIVGLERQRTAVAEALAAGGYADAPVCACLCFMPTEGFFGDAGLPATRTLRIAGFPLYHGRRLCKELKRAGPISEELAALREILSQRFPAHR
jgi:hypothetical protein